MSGGVRQGCGDAVGHLLRDVGDCDADALALDIEDYARPHLFASDARGTAEPPRRGIRFTCISGLHRRLAFSKNAVTTRPRPPEATHTTPRTRPSRSARQPFSVGFRLRFGGDLESMRMCEAIPAGEHEECSDGAGVLEGAVHARCRFGRRSRSCSGDRRPCGPRRRAYTARRTPRRDCTCRAGLL